MQLIDVRLPTPRPDELRAFYVETLGLHHLPLVFERGESATAHFAFNIPENQLAQGKAWLAERVDLVTREGRDEFHSESWNSDCVYFHDPDGNVGELIARHNLINASDGPFGPDSLLELSEVGLPVRDVRRAVDFLESELGLALYESDGEPPFAAVGDEHGLFIVVSEERPWSLGGLPRIAPLRVTLVGDRRQELRLPETPYSLTIVPA